MNRKDPPSIEETIRQARLLQDAYDADIEALCERIGYGNVISSASRLWGQKNDRENMPRTNFTVGPCESMTVPCPHPTQDRNGHCNWCCGSGWLTKRVAELAASMFPPPPSNR